MIQTRIVYESAQGNCSTFVYIVEARLHTNAPLRQFAFDGLRYFYQQSMSKPFIEVPESFVPEFVRESLCSKVTTDENV